MHSLIYKMIYIFILTLSFSVIVYNINSIKLSIKSIVLFTLINYLINYLLYIGGYNNLLMIFIVTSILTYTYRLHKKIDFSTMITAFTVIIYALSDLIISSIEILVLNINRAEIIENPKL